MQQPAFNWRRSYLIKRKKRRQNGHFIAPSFWFISFPNSFNWFIKCACKSYFILQKHYHIDSHVVWTRIQFKEMKEKKEKNWWKEMVKWTRRQFKACFFFFFLAFEKKSWMEQSMHIEQHVSLEKPMITVIYFLSGFFFFNFISILCNYVIVWFANIDKADSLSRDHIDRTSYYILFYFFLSLSLILSFLHLRFLSLTVWSSNNFQPKNNSIRYLDWEQRCNFPSFHWGNFILMMHLCESMYHMLFFPIIVDFFFFSFYNVCASAIARSQ